MRLDPNKLLPLIVLLLITIATFLYIGKTQRIPSFGKPKPAPRSQPQAQPTPPPLAPGTITGSLSFPSEGIPDNLQICARDQTSDITTCTQEHLTSDQYLHGRGYSLDLPPGDYTVFAQLPDSPLKAYYSEFVTCGLTADCPSHQPIIVSLLSGQILENIDPQDWYAPAPTPTQTLDSESATDSAIPEPQL